MTPTGVVATGDSDMRLKKRIIKKKIEELCLQGWLGLMTAKEYSNLLYRVCFLSEKDTNTWYNALVEVQKFYNY
jgi:hypothetical protein